MKEFYIYRSIRSEQAGEEPKRARIKIDDAGLISYLDPTAESFFGVDLDELQGQPLRKLVATRQDDPLAPAHAETLRRGDAIQLTFKHKQGAFFTGKLVAKLDDSQGSGRDDMIIQHRAETPVDQRILKLIEDTAQLGSWELDLQRNLLYWSDGLYRLFDLRPGQEINPEHALYYFHDQQHRMRAIFRRCMSKGKAFDLTLSLHTANQRQRWVRLTGRAIRRDNKIVSMIGTLQEISTQQQQQQQMVQGQLLLDAALDATQDLVLAVDRQFRILMVNRSYQAQFDKTFGNTPQVGQDLLSLLADFPNERRLFQRLWERAFDRETFCVEMPLAQMDRELPIFEIRYHRLMTGQTLLGAMHLARNVTAKTRVSDNLNYLSSHDPMTGLLNRRELLSRVKRAIEITQTRGTPQALLYLDLDDLNPMNESAGPGASDAYLRELATQLSLKVRQRDSLARVAGDKLAVLLDNCSEAEARKVADNLRQQIEQFTHVWQEKTLQTTVSGGLVPILASLPTTLSTTGTANAEDVLIIAADLCQAAKSAGPSRIHVHRQQDTSSSEVERQAQLKTLQHCVSSGNLTLMYQAIKPVNSVTWGDYIEILVRLQCSQDDTKIWYPDEFLPIAERYDLACQLDRQIIANTLQWLADHELMEPRLKLCSFNLSLASLLDPTLPDDIARLLENSPYGADRFCFEIREGDAIRHADAVFTCCERLRDIGCKTALDRAGASAQSYSLVARLPVDFIKLDQHLVNGLATDSVQLVIAEALHKIAEVSGKQTIACFVENDETLREVRRLGIHFAQGFRLGSLKPLDELAPVQLDLSTIRMPSRS